MMTLDDQMEQASAALARMDYLACESLCEAALALARRDEDWAYYGRILLPLQECRRQRRMIAAEGVVRLGTGEAGGGTDHWLNHLPAGCIVVTRPHVAGDALKLLREARERKLFIEVLYADSAVSDERWRVTTFQGPAAMVELPAPPAELRDRWCAPLLPASPAATRMTGTAASAPVASAAAPPTVSPADWFIDASEKLGDGLLCAVTATSPADLVDQLESFVLAAGDHEILHQRLAAAAKRAAKAVVD